MQGSKTLRLQGRRIAATLAASFLTFAGAAQAQNPSLPASPLPPAASVEGAPAPEVVPGPTSVLGGTGCAGCCETPRLEMGLCDTIRESLCGNAGQWRPLSLSNFFSEGWHEPWAGGPAGQCGLTPRHGWLGAFEGVFYRLGLVQGTYQHNLNQPQGGDGYSSNFTTFLPFSRRFELFLSVPFVNANGTEDPNQGYQSDFGDISIAGSFLLSETEACTQLFTLGAILPTGEADTGGNRTVINPRYSFWSNPRDAWVVRGGTGVSIPLNDASGDSTFNAAMAVGYYLTPHDVPFGDLVFYVNTSVTVPLEGDGGNQFGIGPGTRFQIGRDLWFLYYWEFQAGDDKPFDHQMQAAIVKAW